MYAITDPGILCFQHCHTRLFCLSLPKNCNFCCSDLSSTELKIPPFRIPFPFTSASSASHSVLIKPTEGDFLNNYVNSSPLHAGITNSKGDVYEYDIDGVRVSSGSEWIECLKIEITDRYDDTWLQFWDFTLRRIYISPMWKAERYHQDKHNCYSFVLSFLRALKIPNCEPFLKSKVDFCKKFIVPRTVVAAKYLSVYRAVIKNGVKIHSENC